VTTEPTSGNDSGILKVAHEGPALVLTLTRPKVRNALSRELISALTGALREADEDPSIRGVIITGGNDYFSSGADLNEVLTARSPLDVVRLSDALHTLGAAIEGLSKPVVAAIEGFCMTAGLELALACDMRVAGEGASFAITSARIGTVPGFGGTQRLPRIVGRGIALEMLLCAEPVNAQRAYQVGLVNRLTAQGEALAGARALVDLWSSRAPLALRYDKQAVVRGADMDLANALQFEKYLVATVYSSSDRTEGMSAFLNKRAPDFTGT
jgi:enoyl-CoA hydratase/carnithine racemase